MSHSERWILGVGVMMFLSVSTHCWAASVDSLLHKQVPPYDKTLDDVMVTATRTSRLVQDVPMPVSIIKGADIRRMGAIRLNEVLAEQTGLQVVQDHGAGIQMQGLSTDYVLILIDGEPLVGRTKGNLDLTRLVVGNIDRVEVVKGPSSSLFGSEAMGGIINIITRKGTNEFAGSVRSRYRRYNTLDLTAEAGKQQDKLGWYVFANRLASDGYFAKGATTNVTKTVAPFEGYTFSGRLSYRFRPSVELITNIRFYQEDQQNQKLIATDSTARLLAEKTYRRDFSFTPTLHWKITDKSKLQVRNHVTTFATRTRYNYKDDGTIYDDSYFKQLFNRTETQFDHEFNDRNLSTLGVGNVLETVDATRYDTKNAFNQLYVFAQHQWNPVAPLNIVAGFRYDKHNQYADRFSPKVSAGWRIFKNVTLQGGIAGGYKAPTFEQLLLNFTNPTVGYSVFGTRVAEDAVRKLQEEGQIRTILIDPSQIGEIKAETSLAYNIGLKVKPLPKMNIQVNAFRNNISNMIDFNTIAIKINQGSIFSYFNRNEVFTQGLEIQADYCLPFNIVLSAGYQYLEAKDKGVLKSIEEEKMYYRDAHTNLDYKVRREDYGGLYNRSKHSGNIKIMYDNLRYKFDVTLRGIYRGKFGSGLDVNGNGILDDAAEYAEGYMLWNITARKTFWKFTAEAGVNNIFSKDTPYDVTTPPQNWYIGLAWQF